MLKKIVLLLPLLLLITGCGSTYEIEFTQDDTIKDTISIFEDNDKVERFTKKDEEDFLNKLLDFERGYEHYKRELYTTEDITGYKYTYDFTYEEYDAMSQFRKCYEDLTLKVTDDKIELKFIIKEDDIEPEDYPNEDDDCDSINEKLEADIVSDIEDTYNQFFEDNFSCKFVVEVETIYFEGCEFEESSYDWECGEQIGTEHYVSCEKNASGKFKVTVTLFDKEVKA
jgi:hypothetical protein